MDIIHVDRMSSEHIFKIIIVSSCNGCQSHQASTSDKEFMENYGKIVAMKNIAIDHLKEVKKSLDKRNESMQTSSMSKAMIKKQILSL